MATFQARVEAITGTISGTTKLTSWLSEGVIDVTRRMIMIRKDFAPRFASQMTIGSAGTSIGTGMEIFNVRRGSFPASEIDANLRYKSVNTSSIHYITTKNPAYYKLDNKVFVLPAPATATPTKAYASYIAPTSPAYSASTISNFPNELDFMVVMYAAIQDLRCKITAIKFPSNATASTYNSLYPTALSTVTTQIETAEDIELAQVKLAQIAQSLSKEGIDVQDTVGQISHLFDQLKSLLMQYESSFKAYMRPSASKEQ